MLGTEYFDSQVLLSRQWRSPLNQLIPVCVYGIQNLNEITLLYEQLFIQPFFAFYSWNSGNSNTTSLPVSFLYTPENVSTCEDK